LSTTLTQRAEPQVGRRPLGGQDGGRQGGTPSECTDATPCAAILLAAASGRPEREAADCTTRHRV